MHENFSGQVSPVGGQVEQSPEPVKITTTVEILQKLDPEDLKKLCVKLAEVESSTFPDEMAVDAEEIEEVLSNPRGVHILIKDADGHDIGYLSTVPHSENLAGLQEWDPEIIDIPDALYIESIATIPNERSPRNFIETFKKLFDEARAKGYKKITMHARQRRGFSKAIQELFGAKLIKHYDDWCEFGEPFDYLEIDIPEEGSEIIK